jgi:DNA-binding NarL/FixJ family response regulator
VQNIGVLIADSQLIFRQGIRALLERETDIEVLGDTGDGNQIACLVERLRPSVVVTDATLPGNAGAQLARDILQSDPRVEILVLTTQNSAYYVIEMIKAGARGYILKQSTDIELADAIRKLHRGEPVLAQAVLNTIFDDFHLVGSRSNLDGDLTVREREIIELVAAGQTSRKIALALGLSAKTVDNTRGQILIKLRARNMVEAVTTALEQGIIQIAPSARVRASTQK